VALLATLTLGPWLLLQGRRVRRVTPVLPEPPGPRSGRVEPPPELSAPSAPSSPSALKHPSDESKGLRVLITGDSAAAGVGAPHQQQALAGQLPPRLAQAFACPIEWSLVARTGLTVESLCGLLAQQDLGAYDVVLVSIGVNEVTAGTDVSAWQARLNGLHQLLTGRLGARCVLYSGIPPMHRFPALPQPLRWFLGRRARRLDQALAQWVTHAPGAYWVQLPDLPNEAIAVDGFHPGVRAYQAWAEVVVPIAVKAPLHPSQLSRRSERSQRSQRSQPAIESVHTRE